jgi:hypothetical protein
MWRISYKTMSLQEVLIMAYMNVLQAKVSSSFPDHRAYEPLAMRSQQTIGRRE